MSQPETPPRKPRGFAAMDPEKVRAIASKGGKAAHVAGTAHQFSSEEARDAGKKGGVAPHVKRGRGAKQAPLFKDEPEESDKAKRAANGIGDS